MKRNAKKMVLTRSENEHYLLENSIMRTFSNIFQMENPKFPVVFLLVIEVSRKRLFIGFIQLCDDRS